uniref:Macaca fascicularis brain cDNA, clone: QflA-23742 n=1 Tax=Macaca fascicularis TaxID=9541 RepID=I7GDU4_MACFA|nr:unnamed protein product [Macaca fascicularis]
MKLDLLENGEVVYCLNIGTSSYSQVSVATSFPFVWDKFDTNYSF